MSRPSGGFAMADVRSVAILEDYTVSIDPCIPIDPPPEGEDPQGSREGMASTQFDGPPMGSANSTEHEHYHLLRRDTVNNRTSIVEEDVDFTSGPGAGGRASLSAVAPPPLPPRRGRTYIAECGEPPCGFDKSKYFTTAFMAMLIVGIVIGIIHSYGLYIYVIQGEYFVDFIQICFVLALTYAVLIKSTTLASYMIAWVGHRNTALFGMLVFLTGLLMDAFTIHVALFYVSHIVCMGIGGGLAYGSAVCVSGDLFRKHLAMSMILISIGCSLGTILIYLLHFFVLPQIGYLWMKIFLAVLVLLLTGTAHSFPSFEVDIECGIVRSPRCSPKCGNDGIKQCVKEATKEKNKHKKHHKNERQCVCVCICDMTVWSDKSFVLWGICIFLATMALYAPYLFLLAYAETKNMVLSLWYIVTLCIVSLGIRCGIIMGPDYSFGFNRALFMVGVIGSGIMWIIISFANTFGWLVMWCFGMGLMEGLIITTIPRLTLTTIPRHWIESSWGWLLWFHAVGIFLCTVLIAVMARQLGSFELILCTVGLLQILGGLLAILLPNEELSSEAGDDCEEEMDETEVQGLDPEPQEGMEDQTFNNPGPRKSTRLEEQRASRKSTMMGGPYDHPHDGMNDPHNRYPSYDMGSFRVRDARRHSSQSSGHQRASIAQRDVGSMRQTLGDVHGRPTTFSERGSVRSSLAHPEERRSARDTYKPFVERRETEYSHAGGSIAPPPIRSTLAAKQSHVGGNYGTLRFEDNRRSTKINRRVDGSMREAFASMEFASSPLAHGSTTRSSTYDVRRGTQQQHPTGRATRASTQSHSVQRGTAASIRPHDDAWLADERPRLGTMQANWGEKRGIGSFHAHYDGAGPSNTGGGGGSFKGLSSSAKSFIGGGAGRLCGKKSGADSSDFQVCCPICKETNCISGCRGCVPSDLASGSPVIVRTPSDDTLCASSPTSKPADPPAPKESKNAAAVAAPSKSKTSHQDQVVKRTSFEIRKTSKSSPEENKGPIAT